jgi:hypothetical protein
MGVAFSLLNTLADRLPTKCAVKVLDSLAFVESFVITHTPDP